MVRLRPFGESPERTAKLLYLIGAQLYSRDVKLDGWHVLIDATQEEATRALDKAGEILNLKWDDHIRCDWLG